MVELVAQSYLEEESYVFLTDDSGGILTHLNDEFNPTTEKGSINIEDILNGELSDIINKDSLCLQDRKTEDFDGNDRFFFFENIGETDWKVGLSISVDKAMSPINNTIKLTFIMTIIILIMSFIFSIYFAGTINKPLNSAVKMAGNIGELDLSENIELKDLNKKDEIGDMGKSFQMIINKLRLFVKDIGASIGMTNNIYDETINKINQLVNLAEDTSATTEELSTGMEETTASTLSINDSVLGTDKAMKDFVEKVERGAITSEEIAVW